MRVFLFLALIKVLFLSIEQTALAVTDREVEALRAQMITLENSIKAIIPIGTILPYSGAGPLPEGFLLCDGRWLSTTDDQTKPLFEVIGFHFTSDQTQNHESFQLPDLRGRVLLGAGGGETLNHNDLGCKSGSQNCTLTESNLPDHLHKGKTGDQNKHHTHTGKTGDDAPDHSHAYGSSTRISDKNWGECPGHIVSAHQAQSITSGGASDRHQHPFTTAAETQMHQHEFTTKSEPLKFANMPFSVMQPSMSVHYMIRVK